MVVDLFKAASIVSADSEGYLGDLDELDEF